MKLRSDSDDSVIGDSIHVTVAVEFDLVLVMISGTEPR
jgi:hypothetical protein